jgi:hypothetical protein
MQTFHSISRNCMSLESPFGDTILINQQAVFKIERPGTVDGNCTIFATIIAVYV